MDLRGRWWNRRWASARRDLWLYADDGRWIVRAREGERDLAWPPFDVEWRARAWVDRLMASGPDGRAAWKDMIKLVRRPPPRPDAGDDRSDSVS